MVYINTQLILNSCNPNLTHRGNMGWKATLTVHLTALEDQPQTLIFHSSAPQCSIECNCGHQELPPSPISKLYNDLHLL